MNIIQYDLSRKVEQKKFILCIISSFSEENSFSILFLRSGSESSLVT